MGYIPENEMSYRAAYRGKMANKTAKYKYLDDKIFCCLHTGNMQYQPRSQGVLTSYTDHEAE